MIKQTVRRMISWLTALVLFASYVVSGRNDLTCLGMGRYHWHGSDSCRSCCGVSKKNLMPLYFAY